MPRNEKRSTETHLSHTSKGSSPVYKLKLLSKTLSEDVHTCQLFIMQDDNVWAAA